MVARRVSRFLQWAQTTWWGVLDLFYPHQCVGCGCALSDRKQVICAACEEALPRTEHAWKRENNVELKFAEVPLMHSLVRGGAFAYYEYDTPYRRMIHTFKYEHYPQIGEYLGQLAATEFAPHHFFEDVDILVPVPLHTIRLRQRGYNQAEMICQGLSAVTHIPVDTTHLFRAVNTTSQTHKSAQERKANTTGVFMLHNPSDWKGKHILLVDDVITTGATLWACMQAIKGIRGLRVSVFTLGLARTPMIIE